MSNLLQRLRNNAVLSFLLLAGFIIRVAFVLLGLNRIIFPAPYTNDDSWTYTDSFLNLLHHGFYSFCISNPNAAFGRLPGYPFFWGSIYLVAGPQHVYQGVGIAQSMLDTLCIYLLYKIIYKLTSQKVISLIGAAIYTFYLFIIIWMPVSATEAFATDATILLFYLLSRWERPGLLQCFVIGLVAAVCFYIREYLGILVICVCIGWLLNRLVPLRQRIRVVAFICIGFGSLYILWPARNYLSFHRVLLTKTFDAGYKDFNVDYSAFRSWIYSWDNEVETHTNKIIYTKDKLGFPRAIFADQAEADFADSLVNVCRTSGSGFHYWMHRDQLCSIQAIDSINNNALIVQGFDQLRHSFIKRHPLVNYVKVPMLNLKKLVFKSAVRENKGGGRMKALLSAALFGYRSLLVLLGFIGLALMPASVTKRTILVFTIFMYIFIAFIIRQTEMRYILQADIMLLIPACFSINWLLGRFRPRLS